MTDLHLDVEPVMYVLRAYRDPQGRAKGHAFEATLNVFMLGEGRARAFSAMGELDATLIRAIAAKLGELGITTLLLRRHGVEQIWTLENGRIRAVKA